VGSLHPPPQHSHLPGRLIFANVISLYFLVTLNFKNFFWNYINKTDNDPFHTEDDIRDLEMIQPVFSS
jgi:hypothetical protein